MTLKHEQQTATLANHGDRLDRLRLLLEAGVHYAVAYELAACTTRRRIEYVTWLAQLRGRGPGYVVTMLRNNWPSGSGRRRRR